MTEWSHSLSPSLNECPLWGKPYVQGHSRLVTIQAILSLNLREPRSSNVAFSRHCSLSSLPGNRSSQNTGIHKTNPDRENESRKGKYWPGRGEGGGGRGGGGREWDSTSWELQLTNPPRETVSDT